MFLKTLGKCAWKFELDLAKFLSATELVWQATLKKTKVKLELLTDIDIFLMVEKGIRGGLCHSINRYAKNKYIKIMIKIRNLHILNIGKLIICMVGQCHKN